MKTRNSDQIVDNFFTLMGCLILSFLTYLAFSYFVQDLFGEDNYLKMRLFFIALNIIIIALMVLEVFEAFSISNSNDKVPPLKKKKKKNNNKRCTNLAALERARRHKRTKKNKDEIEMESNYLKVVDYER